MAADIETAGLPERIARNAFNKWYGGAGTRTVLLEYTDQGKLWIAFLAGWLARDDDA